MSHWLHINWELFHFLRPSVLYAIIPVIIFSGISLFKTRNTYKWVNFFKPYLKSQFVLKGNEQIKTVFQLIIFFTVVMAIIGAAGPVWQTVEVPGKKLQNPIIVVLDVSQSMMVKDVSPNRLQRAKFKIHDFLSLSPKAQVGLIVFAGSAHMVVPPTADFSIINNQLETLKPSTMPLAGSNPAEAIELALDMCQSAGVPGNIILFTDEVGQSLFNPAQQLATSTQTQLYIQPVITPLGGKIPKPTGKWFTKGGKAVISSLDTNNLSLLSSLANVQVIPFTIDNSDMQKVFDEVQKNLLFVTKGQYKENEWVDMGWQLSLPFFAVLLLLFRRGFVMYSFVLIFTSCNTDSKMAKWFQTPDYRAQQKEQQGAFEEAAVLYEDAYKKGVAYAKAGKSQEALTAFAKDTSAQAKYNMGVVYYNTGDYESAKLSFVAAVEQDSTLLSAVENARTLTLWLGQNSSMESLQAIEEKQKQGANKENKDMEDLGGGGQEAKKEDEKLDRKEETVTTETRTAKELEEVPQNFEDQQSSPQNVLMRKVNDDPALFLKRKFKMQQKQHSKPIKVVDQW